MALQRTVWQRQIVADFYADNAFLNRAVDWDEYVREGYKTVIIPTEGTGSAVARNRTSLPATATARTDGEFQYEMTDYTTDPRYVTDLDQLQMSYNKMASVIAQDMSLIKEAAAVDILYAWRAELAANIVRTSGEATPATSAGATGNRKAMVFMDLVNAAKVMDEGNVPSEGRVALLTPSQILELAKDEDVKKIGLGTALLNYNNLQPFQLAGFTILKRSKVLVYTNAATPVAKLPTANAAATDNMAALCWHPNAVGRSLGNIKVFYDADKPEYYGSMLSMQVQAGGRKRLIGDKGVVAIVQEATA